MKNKSTSRRAFLKDSGKAGLSLGLSSTILPSILQSCSAPVQLAGKVSPTLYVQQPLPYNYKALEPVIDAVTMEIHYTKHAATYAKNLAEATAAEQVNTVQTSLETVLSRISKYSTKMRNNAGGHYNHELFWKCMAPKSKDKPDGKLLSLLNEHFGSFESFKTQFSDAAKTRFGSGWAWLVYDNDRKLKIGSTANQDNPLMDVGTGSGTNDIKGLPLLGLDVWEHAYYLKYQNKRPDYVSNWWSIVNWDFVQQRFESFSS